MMHSPILLNNISLTLSHKVCFESFTKILHPGSRIGVIGPNGCGKSTLLKIISKQVNPSYGDVYLPQHITIGYVPQILENNITLSGAEIFQDALTKAISSRPNFLLIDEPTNHLDYRNKKSLLRMLQSFKGTLIIATHDTEVLDTCIDNLWYIEQGRINLFKGNYQSLLQEQILKKEKLSHELHHLSKEKKETHKALMKEQERAKKSDSRGKKSIKERKWPTIVSDEKARRALETSGKKKRAIRSNREELLETISELQVPKVIKPNFCLTFSNLNRHTIISINEGTIGYETPLLNTINLTITAGEKVAISGDNGSGKTTLLRAILGDPAVKKSGKWLIPSSNEIGYLDQHYKNLDPLKSVIENLKVIVPNWEEKQIRCHLNDFLFRKNEEVHLLTRLLSGGEKARLALALIAAKIPKLLVLDEITNNLDLETRSHVGQVLKDYPGTIIMVSHDERFLNDIHISRIYSIK